MIQLTPLLVARHWPFLDEQLVLGRWKNGRAALELLSRHQVDTGGEPVNLGRKRLVSVCESAGEAGAIWRALVELERRKVIARQRGAGTRPDAWSFRPDVAHWRTMPWKHSGRGVQRALEGCGICRALRAAGAIDPGPRLSLLRGDEVFRLDERHHLGIYPPQSRGNGAERAARAQSPAWGPVDTRGKGAEFGVSQAPPTIPSVVLEELLLNDERAAERYELSKAMLERHAVPGNFVGEGQAPDQRLKRVAIEFPDEVHTEARFRFVKQCVPCWVPSGSENFERMCREVAGEVQAPVAREA